MSLELCILGSGSTGNCSVLRTPAGVMLIDAGLGPRTVAKRLVGTGVQIAHVRAICLTHLDSDHFTPTWAATLIEREIRVFCHERRSDDLLRRVDDDCGARVERDRFRKLVRTFDGKAFRPLQGIHARPIPFVHDHKGSHGFVIEGFGARLGYATDLGHVTDELIRRFENVNVLALESNYDRLMQVASVRPAYLKRRIMGGAGHLSNEQAFDAIKRILDRCERSRRALPSHIVLLHRSRECNCPKLLKRLFSRDARVGSRLTLAEPYQRSGWLGTTRSQTEEQMVLKFA
ncbi:MAG: MBL fold metallo-hydrolase [Tepidisphaeraceae bacterium]